METWRSTYTGHDHALWLTWPIGRMPRISGVNKIFRQRHHISNRLFSRQLLSPYHLVQFCLLPNSPSHPPFLFLRPSLDLAVNGFSCRTQDHLNLTLDPNFLSSITYTPLKLTCIFKFDDLLVYLGMN